MKPVQSPVDTGPCVTRQMPSHTPQLMVVAVNFEPGAEGSIHNYPHVQSTYFGSGRFRFTQRTRTFAIEPGNSFIIPSDILHGCACIEAGRLIDCFTPRCNDFL